MYNFSRNKFSSLNEIIFFEVSFQFWFKSLVNLILNNKVVDELVQGGLNSNSLKDSLNKILKNDNKSKLIESYNDLKSMLYKDNPSKRTAELIIR